MPNDFYSLTAARGSGELFEFSKLRNKVVLIVNVASLCGFTPQYRELQDLYEKYGPEHFEIIAFPCNQFGHQEPAENQGIQKFVHDKFGVTFPVLAKIFVNGDFEHPVFRYLKLEKNGPLGFRGVRWNFEKFLVSSDGVVVARYDTMVNPSLLEAEIASLVAHAQST